MSPPEEDSRDDPRGDARVLARPEHPISRRNIPKSTLKVLSRLDGAGFRAYLVGGSVRDLMLDREPKDFDAGTDARPEEIRKLFRNSRIIGRRFRLAHVYFHDGIIEVATFRREPDPEEQRGDDGELLITDDNRFGSPREDAFRRDFTVNALFYDISDFSVIDYCGGLDDLEAGLIRCIGDPEVRFKEDPVRMLRACEFAARLGFEIEETTQSAIAACYREMEKASPARMTEELIQLLKSGSSNDALGWATDLRLAEVMLPEAADHFEDLLVDGAPDFRGLLPALDAMIAEGRELSDAALVAALLLPSVLLRRDQQEARRGRVLSRRQIQRLVESAVEPFFSRYAFANAKAQGAREALVAFQRLCEPGWTDSRRRAFGHRREFDDALALFTMMVRATGEGGEALDAWKDAAKAQRHKPQTEGRKGRGRGRRHRRRRQGRSRGKRQGRGRAGGS